jgi:hypothetical protein
MPGFWDVFSGKNVHWNKTKDEALRWFIRSMRIVQENIQKNRPEAMPTFLLLRDFEFAFYSAWQAYFSDMLKLKDFEYSEYLYSLNSRSMNIIIAAYSFHFKFLRYTKPEERDFLIDQAYLTKEVYDKSDSYLEAWLDTISWHDELQDDGASLWDRYSHVLYEEIAPLLGLPTHGAALLFYWSGLTNTLAAMATSTMKPPSWRNLVDDAMAGRI